MKARLSKLDRYDLMSGLSVVAVALVTAAVYPALPRRFPVHFNLAGLANGSLPKGEGVWLLPAGAIAMWLLLRAGSALLAAAWRERLEASPTSLVALAVVALLLLLQGVCLHAASHPGVPLGWALWGALGLYFILVGQLMPRVRRNPWIGIRTAWTLSSDENWLRTHRVAGIAMTLGGAGALVAAWFSPTVALCSILMGVLFPAGYSFVLARRLPSQG